MSEILEGYARTGLMVVMPFAVVKLPVEHFHALHNEVQSGHHAVKNVEEDGEMRTQ